MKYKIPYIFLGILALTACTDDTDVYNIGSEDSFQLSARKGDQTISRSVPPNSYFEVGNKYRFWIYEGIRTQQEIDDKDISSLDKNILTETSADGNIVTEGPTHYLEFSDENKRKIKGQKEIFGFTDIHTDDAIDVSDPTKFEITYDPYLKEENEVMWSDPGFPDYCRGYLAYDASSMTEGVQIVEFKHILSKLQVTIVQQGKDSYAPDEEGNLTDEIIDKERYEIQLKKAIIKDVYYQGQYNILTDEWSYPVHDPRTRTFISYNEPKDIPYMVDEIVSTNLQVSTLFVPQKRGAEDQIGNGEPLKLRLVITGKDAPNFENSNNKIITKEELEEENKTVNGDQVTLDDGDVMVELDLTDHLGNILSFEPNYLYKLVVVFQGDDVNIVSVTPYIYPWFDGETSEVDEDGVYQEQEVGTPGVFADLQWNDRYMGASRAGATTMDEFVEATGFYYQKDRTIPFFPSIYDPNYEGYLIDADGNRWDYDTFYGIDDYGLSYTLNAKGEKVYSLNVSFKEIDRSVFTDVWKTDYAKYNNAIAKIKIHRHDDPEDTYEIVLHSHQSDGTLIGHTQDKDHLFTQVGGKWEDLFYSHYNLSNTQKTSNSLNCMWDLPRVFPITSYFLTPRQKLALNAKGEFNQSRFWNDIFKYGYNYSTKDFDESGWNQKGEIDDENTYGPAWFFGEWHNPDTYCTSPDNFNGSNFIRFIGEYNYYPSYTWRDTNKQPCPPGWRLPTKQEMNTILPSTPLAGNICMLNAFGVGDGTFGGNGDPDNVFQFESKEIYLKLPYEKEDDIYPKLTDVEYVNWTEEYRNNIYFPSGDPYSGDNAQYVISRRTWTPEEWATIPDQEKACFSDQNQYTNYASKVAPNPLKPYIDKPLINQNQKHDDVFWGVIYAIKKQGTADAYRMRWRVERVCGKVQVTTDKTTYIENEAYQLVVEKYKALPTDKLLYSLEDINNQYFFLNYDWDNPESVIYFPITGIVGEQLMSQWNCGAAIYNYGTETIILTSDYDTRGEKMFQSSYRIKIAGTNFTSQYIYPTMDRLAQGGQVRPVRTSR